MSLRVECLMWEEELLDDLAAYEQLQRKSREHVQPEAESRYVNEGVILERNFSESVPHRHFDTFLLTREKLFKMLPCVLSVKTRNADIASVQHANNEIAVDTCVTIANRSRVGVLKLP